MTKFEKIKLVEINPHLTCHLCKGYYIDATTIVECLHSFCRSCIIKFLENNSYCPICEVIINKAKPNIKPDKTLQDVVYKLVPELFLNEMHRRQQFYSKHPQEAAKVTPEARGEDTERTIFHPRDTISLSIEYTSDESPNCLLPLPHQSAHQICATPTKASVVTTRSSSQTCGTLNPTPSDASAMKRFLQCPAMLRVDVLKKFVSRKYNVDMAKFHIDILYKRVPLPDQYTLIDIAYIYSWKRNEPMRFFFRIMDAALVQEESAQDFVSAPPKALSSPAASNKSPGPTKPDLVDENVPPKGVAKDTSQISSPNELKSKPVPSVDKDTKIAVPVLNEDNKNNQSNLPSSKTKAKGCAVAPVTPPEVAKDGKEKNGKIAGVQNLKNCIVMQYVSSNAVGNKVAKQPESAKVEKTAPSPKAVLKTSPTPKVVEKKPPSPKVILKSEPPSPIKTIPPVPTTPPPLSVKSKIEFPSSPEVDMEKSQFLKSIQLTAKSNVSPAKSDPLPNSPTAPQKSPPKVKAPSPSSVQQPPVPPLKLPATAPKRPASSPARSPKKPKAPKRESPAKKSPVNAAAKNGVHNPMVRQMISNVSQQVTNLRQDVSKIVGQKSPETNSELKSLFDSCKINIPSSLSITLKETDGVSNCKVATSIKPVQNYIEILKLPDQPLPVAAKSPSEAKALPKAAQGAQNVLQAKEKPNTPPLNVPEPKPSPKPKEPTPKAAETNPQKSSTCNMVAQKLAMAPKTVKIVNSLEQTQELPKKPSATPNLAQMLQNTPHALPKNTPQNTPNSMAQNKLENAAKSFQKMFEEAVKNDFNKVASGFPMEGARSKKGGEAHCKAQNGSTPKQASALDLSTPPNGVDSTQGGHNNNNNKRNIAEIAQQLYKKTKLEQEKQLNNNHPPAKAAPINGTQSSSPGQTPNGKVAIPRLPVARVPIPQPIQTFQSYVNQQRIQTGPQDPKRSPQKPMPLPPPSPHPTNSATHTQPMMKSPTVAVSPKTSVQNQVSKAHSPKVSASSPKSNLSPATALGDLSPNQLLEKYNIPNLAQLSANFNLAQAGHLAALQQAFVLKQFEMQNRQNWLNMNPNLAVQYEKFLQNLNHPQGHQLLGNKSEH